MQGATNTLSRCTRRMLIHSVMYLRIAWVNAYFARAEGGLCLLVLTDVVQQVFSSGRHRMAKCGGLASNNIVAVLFLSVYFLFLLFFFLFPFEKVPAMCQDTIERHDNAESRCLDHARESDRTVFLEKRGTRALHAKHHRLCPFTHCRSIWSLFFGSVLERNLERSRSGLVRDLLSLERGNKVRLVGKILSKRKSLIAVSVHPPRKIDYLPNRQAACLSISSLMRTIMTADVSQITRDQYCSLFSPSLSTDLSVFALSKFLGAKFHAGSRVNSNSSYLALMSSVWSGANIFARKNLESLSRNNRDNAYPFEQLMTQKERLMIFHPEKREERISK